MKETGKKSETLTILTFVGCYLPGYKSGGPVRTIANMVEHLGDEFHLRIVTQDRDALDTEPYSSVKVDDWNTVGKAKVFYASPLTMKLWEVSRLLRETPHDALYLNSFFSFKFTALPLLSRRLGLAPRQPCVISPRGEFSAGALALKARKKRIYLELTRALGLYSGLIWQASSEHEEADICQWFGKDVPVVVAQNLPPVIHSADELPPKSGKTKGWLKIIFLSRISRKKNLDGALKMLKGLKGKVEFNIYGPMEDKSYWAECQKIISDLPENIAVRYCGSVEHDKVGALMRGHDIFLFPTLGENFGHVILEALCVGCPILISDQTPWRDLEGKGVGWDLPLDRSEPFREVLQKCADMGNAEYLEWSEKVRYYGLQVIRDDGVVEQNQRLFYKAVDMMNNRQEKMNV